MNRRTSQPNEPLIYLRGRFGLMIPVTRDLYEDYAPLREMLEAEISRSIALPPDHSQRAEFPNVPLGDPRVPLGVSS